jgi:APA family basic amino acid/polyamine antiporter
VGLAAIWVLTAVNAAGVRQGGIVQATTTVVKLIPLLAIATLGLFWFDTDTFGAFNPSGDGAFGAVNAAAALTLWAFIGLESATVPAEDVEDPKRTIPRSTIIGTAIAAAVYILGTVAVMGVIPADALATSGAPFADAATEMWGSWAGDAVAIGAIVSAFGALNGWILLQGQVPMAAARDGLFPRVFAKVSRNGTPVVGLVVSSVLVTGLMAMNYNASLVDQFTFIILLATLTTLIPYAYSAAAQVMLLITDPEHFSGAKLARDVVIASLAFAYSLWAIAGSGYQVVFRGFLLLMAGLPVYIWVVWRRERSTALTVPEGLTARPDVPELQTPTSSR